MGAEDPWSAYAYAYVDHRYKNTKAQMTELTRNDGPVCLRRKLIIKNDIPGSIAPGRIPDPPDLGEVQK